MRVCIVGFGPRGLASLEFLIARAIEAGKLNELSITIFDAANELGTGKAWALDQPQSNWINISDHALKNLKGRARMVHGNYALPAFTSYTQWCSENNLTGDSEDDKDEYPPRTQMGKYLNERAKSIVNPLVKFDLLEIYKSKVQSVTKNNNVFEVVNEGQKKVICDECLITIGHQPVQDTEEFAANKIHAEKHDCLYVHNPYEYDLVGLDYSNKTVAIIGFGLSTIDIIRMLTVEQGGSFEKNDNSISLNYISSGREPLKIVPYSFSGLPCVPKPYGRLVDQEFEPSNKQMHLFGSKIKNALKDIKNITSTKFLVDIFAEIAKEIFLELDNRIDLTDLDKNNLNTQISNWLQDSDSSDSLFLDTQLPARDYMVSIVEMSMGKRPYTLDFSLGQTWRHIQPTLYRLFSFSELHDDVMTEIIQLDERTKRYSYGPPVESIQQLIALTDAGILDLSYVNDPVIKTISNGWKLAKDGHEIIAGTLVNSVLDAPDLAKMESPIMENLKKNGLITTVADGLGAATKSDGTTLLEGETSRFPLAIIGRNAKGSILGADAILECFSPDIAEWAAEVVKRI